MQVLVWGRQKGVKPVSGIPKNGYPMAYTDIYNIECIITGLRDE
jgi:hypothetical protein